MSPRAWSAFFAALFLLGLASSVAEGAWPHDPTVNVQVAPFSANQYANSIVSDGAGGAIVAWYELRSGNYDIFAQRITATGAIAPGWPATGLVVCNATGDQFEPVLVSDGAGGAIIAWTDRRLGALNGDIFAQRVTGAGTIAPGWPANGRQLTSVNPTKDEDRPHIVSDGAGGAVVTWRLIYTAATDYDIYGARVNSSATVLWSNGIWFPVGIQDPAPIVSDGAAGAIVAFEDTGDIWAIRVGSGGSLVWGPSAVATLSGTQTAPATVTDGAGGIIVAWQDDRFGTFDVFVSRLTSSGTVVAGWPAYGLQVSNGSGAEIYQSLASDANHGAIVAWLDGSSDVVRASHIQASGIDPAWPVGGTSLTPGGSVRYPNSIASDGTGGAIVAIQDGRGGTYDTYAARVTSAGFVPPGWSYGGTPVCAAPSTQTNPVMTADGNGGAIIAWTDFRDGIRSNVYAQNIDHFGQLGGAAPSFVSLSDVHGDQGGQVKVVWNGSYLDADPAYAIGEYWIWRQSPATAANIAVRSGARWLDADLEREIGAMSSEKRGALARRGLYTLSIVNSVAYAWEFLAAQPASGFPQYSYVASTSRDSSGSGNPYTVFMVQARYSSGIAFWNSAPDSTYSVDNLPPLTPAPFTGAYLSGATHLHWGANSEPDLAGYRLYRGSSSSFVPGPGNLVVAKPDTGYADAGPAGSYYKLSAVDIHGNESGFALLTPTGTLDSPDALPREIALSLPTPNPAHGVTTLRVALPARGRVSLRLYDAGGRLVRRLLDGEIEAGERAERWDGNDDAGRRSPSGLYFARLQVGGREIVRRVILSR